MKIDSKNRTQLFVNPRKSTKKIFYKLYSFKFFGKLWSQVAITLNPKIINLKKICLSNKSIRLKSPSPLQIFLLLKNKYQIVFQTKLLI